MSASSEYDPASESMGCDGYDLELGLLPNPGFRSESTGRWRVAASLVQLRQQVNAAFPNRSDDSDGTIGDGAHQATDSDHNPWVRDGADGVVTAIDITHDPSNGCDAERITAALVGSRDARIKYVIWNRRIASSAAKGSIPAWTWRSYTRPNPHTKHFHLSVKSDKARYDATAPWSLKSIAESPGPDAADGDRDVLLGLSAVAQTIDLDAEALPQLIAMQDVVDRLLVNHAKTWVYADTEVGSESIAPSDYESLFASAEVRKGREASVRWHLAMLRRGRKRYDDVERRTQVPWWFVGIVHMMEAGFSFNTHLHNGDPLTAKTVQKPKGHPKSGSPPFEWVSSAVDAIELKDFAGLDDWSVAATLYRFESYNGFGYRARNINSPYLWSFANHYTAGKYVSDGRYDPSAVSRQCGAAVALRALVDAGDVTMDG